MKSSSHVIIYENVCLNECHYYQVCCFKGEWSTSTLQLTEVKYMLVHCSHRFSGVLQPSFKFIYTAFLTLPHYSPIKQSFQTLIVVIFPKCSFLSLHRWTSSGRCWHFGDSAAFTRSAKTSQLSDFKIIGGSSNCDAFFQLMKADMSKSLANSLFTHTVDAQQH